MKTLHQILLAAAALSVGYALGLYFNPLSSAIPTSRPEVSTVEETRVRTDGGKMDEAVSLAVGALLERSDIRELARLHTLLDVFDIGQVRALMDRINVMAQSDRRVLLPRVLSYWTRRDPEGATEWMLPHLARYAKQDWFGSGFANFDTDFVGAWSENAPERAFEVARQFAGTGLAGNILHAAILRWPGKDSAAAFHALMTYPPGKERQRVLTSLCFSWAQEDRDAALTTVSTLPPGPERDGALGELLAHLALRDPAAAFKQAGTLALTDLSWLAVLVNEASKTDPAMAVRWLEEQEPEFISKIGPVAVQFWAEKDPAAAFAWAQAHGISITSSLSSTSGTGMHRWEMNFPSPLNRAVQKQPDAAIAWVLAQAEGPDRERYLEVVIQASSQVEKVMPLLQELSGESANRVAASIAWHLGQQGPEQVRGWAESLSAGSQREAAWTAFGATRTEPLDIPPGPDLDAMLVGIAVTHSGHLPLKSLQRVAEIKDAALRRRTFDDVMWRVTRGTIHYGNGASSPGLSDSEIRKVQEWLNTSEIPEEWKKQWAL